MGCGSNYFSAHPFLNCQKGELLMRYQQETNYILHLLKCAISDETPKLPDSELDWDFIYRLANQHKITSTLYFGIMKLPKDYVETIPHIDKYVFLYKKNLVLDANRAFELERLQPIFDSEGIDYIFLKGSVIKKYYPDTSMRRMSDVDILFRGADFQKIDKIFQGLGYEILHKDAKDTAYKNPMNDVAIEMQPHLIDIGYSKWYEYLEEIWDKCSHNRHEYTMPMEDYYIYHIIHMAKHFKNGGIGLTHVLDVYVMQENLINIDWNYVEAQLTKIGLNKFNSVIKMIANHWFGTGDTNGFSAEQVELITIFIFSAGAFGSKKQQETNFIVARGDNKVSLRKKIFPNMTTMMNYYGDFLNRHKYLLPLYWMRLNINRLFRYDKNMKEMRESISSIDEARISKTKVIMEMCGLK